MLIETLKKMLKDAPDLKIEDKFIKLFNLDVHDKPITIAQAKIIAAISPKIALHMFKKNFYKNVLNALIKELVYDEIDDEQRVSEILVTFSELLSAVSENEIQTINDTIIEDFYSRCKEKGRLAFYVDFIAHYCLHSNINYEKFAGYYLRNVLQLMNDKNEKIVEKVVQAFKAIINGLQKENQFSHIALIKDVIEQLGLE